MTAVSLTIDGRPVTVPDGATVLDSARLAGIDIPTFCHLLGKPAQTSCLVCVVRIDGGARLRPACGTKVAEGMRVESSSPEVRAARRTALELLLGHHLGDCLAPCESICPTRYDVPLMLRQVQAGRLDLAIATIKQGLAMPATFGRICQHFCERGCRRANADGAVSIQAVERLVADADLAAGNPYRPPCRPSTGKRVTVVGSGPAGLSAAYHLSRFGYACTLIDENDRAGGQLRRAVADGLLTAEVLDAEIATIMRLGVAFRPGARLGRDVTLERLRAESDAVLIAVGALDADRARTIGLVFADQGLAMVAGTFRTSLPGVFAAGNAVVRDRPAIRSAGAGGLAAEAIDAVLGGASAGHRQRDWSIHIGKLPPDRLAPWLAGASAGKRREAGPAGLDLAQAGAEAARCLRCNCASRDACRLRRYAEEYGAEANRFRGELPPLAIDRSNPLVDFEPGKCILCGLCVLVAAEHGEKLGLGFIGRGFRVQVAAPFHGDLRDGLAVAARACAEVCPTGAIALKDQSPGTAGSPIPPTQRTMIVASPRPSPRRSTISSVGLMAFVLVAGGAFASEAAMPASDPATTAAGSLLDRVIALNRVQEEELDVAAVRGAFAALVEQARRATADMPTPVGKIAELNRVILTDRQVSYLSNQTWRDSTLAASLLRKAGNCLSTATLYVLVGRELKLPLHMVVVPYHAFACWDEAGTRINIETTAKGVAWPLERYLRDLTPEDVVALGWGRPLDDDGFLAELTEAAADHRQRENKLTEALALFAEVERLAPGRGDLRLAHILLKGDLTHERRTEGEELGRMADDERLPPTIRTQAMLGVAQLCAAFREYDQENSLLLNAFDFAPKSAQVDVLSALAFCHRSLRDPRAALRYYELVIAGYRAPSPLRAHHLYNLSILQKNDHQLEAALKSIREAIRINPESWNLRMIEAGYLFQRGQHEEALKRFAAIEPPRDDVEFYQGMLAWFYAKTLQREKFYEHFERALAAANSVHTLIWVDQDEDLDPYRKEPEFANLVERHRCRILGLPAPAAKPEPASAPAPPPALP